MVPAVTSWTDLFKGNNAGYDGSKEANVDSDQATYSNAERPFPRGVSIKGKSLGFPLADIDGLNASRSSKGDTPRSSRATGPGNSGSNSCT